MPTIEPPQFSPTARAELRASLAQLAGSLDPVLVLMHNTGMDGYAARAELALRIRRAIAPALAAMETMRAGFAAAMESIQRAHDADPAAFHQLSGHRRAVGCPLCGPPQADETHPDAAAERPADTGQADARAGEADAAVGDPPR